MIVRSAMLFDINSTCKAHNSASPGAFTNITYAIIFQLDDYLYKLYDYIFLTIVNKQQKTYAEIVQLF